MRKVINAIFRRLNEKFLAQKTERLATNVVYKGKEEIATCLLFYVAGAEPFEAKKVLKNSLPHVQLKQLCFVPLDRRVIEEADVVYYYHKELTWKGHIPNEQLGEMLSRKFDLLVDLTDRSNVLTQYVLKNSQACCIVGRKSKESFADIMIDGVKDDSDFVMKLVTLLAEINGYDHGKI